MPAINPRFVNQTNPYLHLWKKTLKSVQYKNEY